MKKVFVIVTVLLLFFVQPLAFAAEGLTENEEYVHINGEDFYNETADKIISGNLSFKPLPIIQKGVDLLFEELKKSRVEMINLLVIVMLSGALQILKSQETGDGVSDAANFVCFIMITISVLKIFKITADYGTEIISNMSVFITKLSPVFMALLATGGSVSSAAAFHPVLSGAVYAITLLIEKCVVPLITLSAVLGIAGHITPSLKLTSFTALIRSIGKWILTAALTVFTGITAIYGFSAPAFDAVALKTMKFAVGSFVPVVGGILSETVETVLSGTQLMKNAVGVAGIVSLIVISFVPALKICAVLIMLRICTAAAEPIAEKQICDMLKDVTASVSLILGMIMTVTVLFIICIAIILGATN